MEDQVRTETPSKTWSGEYFTKKTNKTKRNTDEDIFAKSKTNGTEITRQCEVNRDGTEETIFRAENWCIKEES